MRNSLFRRFVAVTAATSALIGCGEEPSSSKSQPDAPARTVIDPQLRAIDKATGVERTLADQSDARRREIEQAETR